MHVWNIWLYAKQNTRWVNNFNLTTLIRHILPHLLNERREPWEMLTTWSFKIWFHQPWVFVTFQQYHLQNKIQAVATATIAHAQTPFRLALRWTVELSKDSWQLVGFNWWSAVYFFLQQTDIELGTGKWNQPIGSYFSQ